jgi:hypothetical protein
VNTDKSSSPGQIGFLDKGAIHYLERVQTQNLALNNTLKYNYKKAETSINEVIPKTRLRAKKVTTNFEPGSRKDANVGM